MDETPCFLDMIMDTTVDFVGKKNIEVITSGKEKCKISIILSVTGEGYKLPPFIIVKGEEGKTFKKKLKIYIL